MDYLGIVKKAYEITIRNKFLWIFGILAGGFGGFKGINTNFANYQTNGSELTDKMTSADFVNFWQVWGNLIISLIIVVICLAIVFFILNIVSQGALIGSVDDLEKGKKSNFHDGFQIGTRYFWRILGIIFLYVLMVLASVVLLVGPIIILVVLGQVALAIIWGILLFFVCLAFWVLVGLILPYSLRFVVLENKKVWESVRGGLHFFRDHWIPVILMYLLLWGIGIGFGIALILAALICGGLLLAIGFGVWLASPVVALGYAVLVGLAFVIVLLVISGAYGAFGSAVLTLTYNSLNKRG